MPALGPLRLPCVEPHHVSLNRLGMSSEEGSRSRSRVITPPDKPASQPQFKVARQSVEVVTHGSRKSTSRKPGSQHARSDELAWPENQRGVVEFTSGAEF